MNGPERPDGRSWLTLRLQFDMPPVLWGSLWAALCGGLSGGGLPSDASSLLRFLVVLALADPLIGNMCQVLFDTDWPRPRGGVVPATAGQQAPGLPYTAVGSPAFRLTAGLSGLLTWWRSEFFPRAGSALATLVAQAAALLAGGWLLGEPAIWLVIGLLAWLIIALAVRAGSSVVAGAMRAAGESMWPWIIGFGAFAQLTWPALTLAGLFAVVYWAGLRAHERSTVARDPSLAFGLSGMAVCLAAFRYPVSAVLVACISALPSWLSLSASGLTGSGSFLQRIRWYVLAATLVSALTIR